MTRNSLYTRLFAALFILAFFSFAVLTSAVNSSGGEFNVTPDSIALNWTSSYHGNITLGATDVNETEANLTLYLLNATTCIGSAYSQEGFYDGNPYNESKYYSGGQPACFHSGVPAPDYGNPLIVMNGTGIYTNIAANMTNGSAENFTVIHYVMCPPGRYSGNLTTSNSSIWNDTNASTANTTVILDILLSTRNQLNATTGHALFGGYFPTNATTWHSYYFNTSNMTNATSVFFNTTWSDSAKDLDLFLFDGSGALKARSIGRGVQEGLSYNYLPPAEVWELRVFGNFTGPTELYTIQSQFSTLNVTNTTDSTTFDIIDFGARNVSHSQLVNITITNQGSLTPTVAENGGVWHVDRFSGSGSANHTILVPDSVTAADPNIFNWTVRAWMNWSGSSNYTLNLYKPDSTLVESSNDKQKTSNESGAEKVEFIETTETGAGLWVIEVINNSGSDSYTLEARFQTDASTWANTTYSPSVFNKTGVGNYTRNHTINFTVPSTALSGLYEGIIAYISPAYTHYITLPMSMNITTPVLLVNNTLNSSTVRMTDNIGFNRTGDQLSVTVLINNTGNQNITFEPSSNSTNLSKGSYTMGFEYTYPSTIFAGESGQLDINITIDTNKTGNSPGIYSGWIFLNDTESHPYPGFNLTLEVNLTNDLTITINEIRIPQAGDNWINNVTNPENITTFLNAYYTNGTEITNASQLTLNNFSFWLHEPNGSYRVPASGYLSKSNFTVHLYETDMYKINLTGLPSNIPGGFYRLYSTVTHSPNNITLSGTGDTSPVIVNNTGLKLGVAASPAGFIYEGGNKTHINVSVTNYGPKAATGLLNISDCAYITETAKNKLDGCGTQNTRDFTVSIAPNGTETCWYYWELASVASVDESKSCTFTVSTVETNFGNLGGIDVQVTNVEGESSNDPATGGPIPCTSDINCPAGYCCKDSVCTLLDCTSEQYEEAHTCKDHNYTLEILGFTPLSDVLLGNSVTTSVNVNNTGSGAMQVKVNATVGDGITSTTAPVSFTIGEGNNYTFTVNITASSSASTGNHSSTFTAWKSSGTATSSTSAAFVLTVLPNTGRVAEINLSYQEYSDILDNITSRFDAIKSGGFVSEENLSTVQTLLNQSLTIRQQAKDALGLGDYVQAESLLNDLNSTFFRLEQELSLLESEYGVGRSGFDNAVLVYGMVGAIVASAAVFIIYMFLPPSGYTPKRGFKAKSRWDVRKMVNRFKEKIKRKKGTFKISAKKVTKATSRSKGKRFRYKYKR